MVESSLLPTSLSQFTLKETGLLVNGEPSRTEWEDVGRHIGVFCSSCRWVVGDWLIIGEKRWGEMYEEAQLITGLEYKTLANSKSICSIFEFSLRRENLTFFTHSCAASLPISERTSLLAEAESQKLTGRQVMARVKEIKAASASKRQLGFQFTDEREVILAFLHERRESWPEQFRSSFCNVVRGVLEDMEDSNANG